MWFINTQLVIPADRLIAANWVYQVAICSTIMGITQAPYNAAINSHEDLRYMHISIFYLLSKTGNSINCIIEQVA